MPCKLSLKLLHLLELKGPVLNLLVYLPLDLELLAMSDVMLFLLYKLR
jgi:hypothetical protein